MDVIDIILICLLGVWCIGFAWDMLGLRELIRKFRK